MTCPCCNGDRGFDITALEAPLAQLAYVLSLDYEPVTFILCDVCEGDGEVSPELAREYEAWAVARVDQLLAAVDSGEVVVP